MVTDRNYAKIIKFSRLIVRTVRIRAWCSLSYLPDELPVMKIDQQIVVVTKVLQLHV